MIAPVSAIVFNIDKTKGFLMADSKQRLGKADRSRVSGSQSSEVSYVARKFGVSAATVRRVIKRVGNSRKKVYAALSKF